jgi:putative colanic acid biosynthesis acetyltransferase WcaF
VKVGGGEQSLQSRSSTSAIRDRDGRLHQGASMIPDYQRLDEFTLPPGFRGRSAVVVQLWWLVQALLFAPSPQIMFAWRRFLLRLFGAKIGRDVKIRPSATVTYPWKLTIGDHSWIGDDSTLYSLGTIDIGAHAVISHKVYLCAGSHDYSKRGFDILSPHITVGDQVWIANDVFVAPGVTIGAGAVIGARSSVFSDMPSGMVCKGSPAVSYKERTIKAPAKRA